MTTIPEYYYPVVASTMDVARSIARGFTESGSSSPDTPPVHTGRQGPVAAPGDPGTPPDLFRVRTDHQTDGRGRRGNRWVDRPGDAIMMTIAVRRGSSHDPGDDNPGTLALRVGAMLVETLAGREGVTVKWPNDILYRDRKVAGVLVEADSRWFYIGIGINAYEADETAGTFYARAVADGHGPPDSTSASGSTRAPGSTSAPDPSRYHPVIAPGTIREIPGCPVGDALLRRFDSYFFLLIRGDRWYRTISDNLAWLDCTVTVGDSAAETTGTFRGISRDGAALLERGGTTAPRYAGTMRLTDAAP